MRLKKPEPSNVQGICVLCKERPQRSKPGGLFKPICRSCERRKYPASKESKRNKRIRERRPYILFRKSFCERCGFIPEHECQLDVDHIDGNHDNNGESNLQTLCANCHRLKTFVNQDWKSTDKALVDES